MSLIDAKATFDGKLLLFTVHEEGGCFMKYFFWPNTCPCLGPAVMKNTYTDEKNGCDAPHARADPASRRDHAPRLRRTSRRMGHKATLCGGCVPMSPCPCCLYCGVGPCAAEWHFKQAESRPHTQCTPTPCPFPSVHC